MNKEQIAHDLAMAYIHNRYGAEISGEFSISSIKNHDVGAVDDVTGSGTVQTHRMPGVFASETIRVKTGERHLFGIGPAKTAEVPTGAYAIDQTFRRMIKDYYNAYERLLELLSTR